MRLASCLAIGLTLFLAREAEARPSVELTTTVGGADASEYLVRVSNPDASPSRGVIELRRADEHAVAEAPFDVPANATRYFRVLGEKGQLEAVVIASGATVRGQDRFPRDGSAVIFDIPARDDQRLHDLRIHATNNTIITHATFDETTQAPILTRRAAVYESVALVLVPSSVLLALPGAERAALITWVRTGGAIGLSVSDETDLARLSDLIGEGVKGSTGSDMQTTWSGGRLHMASFVATADVGLGQVHLLPSSPWSAPVTSEVALQEKLVELAGRHRGLGHFSNGPWADSPPSALDPNDGYRSVLAIAGVLLVVQALVTAFVFRRRAVRRGMGPAYRFVMGSSAVAFASVIGLGIYAKGGFGARAREISYADAASGESVAWVQRNRTYFASDARTIEVTPRDASNLLASRDSRVMERGEDAHVVLAGVGIRPWQATAVTERGTTTLGGGVRVEWEQGNVIVRNRAGSTLRNVFVATPGGRCLSFGDIANGEDKTFGTPQSCAELGAAWAPYDNRVPYGSSLHTYLVSPNRLTLVGQLEEGPASINGFRLEKRTTLLRVTGGDS